MSQSIRVPTLVGLFIARKCTPEIGTQILGLKGSRALGNPAFPLRNSKPAIPSTHPNIAFASSRNKTARKPGNCVIWFVNSA
jgi:hypothetical protein